MNAIPIRSPGLASLARPTVTSVLLSLVVMALAVATAHAQVTVSKSEAEPVVTVNELVRQALENNPEILAAQKKYEAAKARPTQESSLPDPMVSFGYRNMTTPLPFTSIGDDPQANAGVTFSQELPFPGKLKLRGQMAEQEAAAELQEYRNTELRVAARLKQAYYQLHYIYRAAGIAARSKDLLEKFSRIAESRYSVGKAQQQDVLRAQVEVSILIRQLRKLEQEKQTAKAAINALLNRPATAPLGRPADYTKSELAATFEQIRARALQNSPALQREQAMVQKSQAGLALARRDYYPDFGVMGGYFNSGRFPDMWEFRFDVKVPLYFWRKQRAAVQEQNARLSASRYEYAAAGRELDAALKEAWEAAQSSDELLTLYAKGILPQSTLTMESSLSSYQVGTVDFLTLLSNFRTVLDYEMNYYEELAAYQKALARLEELSGVPLT